MLTGFMAGEASPLIGGRVDTQQYTFGLALCENFVPINEGPLVKRPGFEFIRDADATASWLSAFRFSITQEYLIEWDELKARFFTNGGRIETAPNVAYEVTTPYTAAEAPLLSTQQSYDRLYIDHASHAPAALSRTSAVTFVHADTLLVNGPFADQNIDETLTVTSTGWAVGAAVTVTASGAVFAAGHVDALFRIEANDFSDIKVWEPGMKGIVVGERVRSDGKAYEAQSGDKTGSIQPTHASGSEWDGQGKQDEINTKGPYGVKWKFLHERFGIVKVTGFTSPTQVSATVLKALPTSTTSVATFKWAHGAFSAARGWPSLVRHWNGRQVHFKGLDIAASVAGDLLNHAAYTSSGLTAADLAFRRTIDAEDPPLWIVGDNKKLLVGTARSELAIGAVNEQAAVAGDNIQSLPQSFYGSEPIFPLQIGTETIFMERGGRRIRAAGYDLSRDRYTAPDLTAAARHITAGGVVQLAYQRQPFAMLHMVRSDGQVVVHPINRDDLKGFARSVLGGAAAVLSAQAIVGADGKSDELWVLVSRVTPAGTRREIWKQAAWRDLGDAQDEAFFVDGGVRIAAAAGQTVFAGLTHLAGQDVAVLANGGVVPGMSVSAGGVLTLPARVVPAFAYVVIVGLGYVATAVTLPPAVQAGGEWIVGLRQRLVKLAVKLIETLGIKIGGNGPLEEVIDRPSSAPMDAAIPLFTGVTSGNVDTTFDRNGQATFISDVPLPAMVSAAFLKINVDGEDA